MRKNISYSLVLSMILLGCGGGTGVQNDETEFTDTYAKTTMNFSKAANDGITDTFTIKKVTADGCDVIPIDPITVTLNSKGEISQDIQADFDPAPCYTDKLYISYEHSENNLTPDKKTVEVLNPQYDQSSVTGLENSDLLFKYQWYLNPEAVNYDLITSLNKLNIDVQKVWESGITGKNVNITLIGGGVDMFHPDLKNNIDMQDSYNFTNSIKNTTPWGQYDPAKAKTTELAGIMVAQADNKIGIKGIAYNAKLISLKVTDANTSATGSDYFLASLIKNIDISDIYLLQSQNSDNIDKDKFNAQISTGVQKGRDGLGSVYVMGVGDNVQNTQLNKLLINENIIPVGVVVNSGQRASYAGYGDNILISGLSGEQITDPVLDKDKTGIVTTDLAGNERGADTEDSVYGSELHFDVVGNENYDYTEKSWGSDDAAAMVAGVVALMLEANPELTYRDIKVILARTANTAGLISSNWIKNAKGYYYSKDFGFGLVDADKAVQMAKYFSKLPARLSIDENINPYAVSDDGVLDYTFNVDKNVAIEEVKVSLTFDDSTAPFVTDTYTNSGTGDKLAYYKLYGGENNLTLNFDSNTSTIDIGIYDSSDNLIDTLSFAQSGTQTFTLPQTDTYKLDLKVKDANETIAQSVNWNYTVVSPHPNASFDNLNITLVSPAGTPCELLNAADSYNGTLNAETFMCYPFLDESSEGAWTLKVNSTDGGEFKVNSVNMKILGH